MIRAADMYDVEWIAPRLRKADLDELRASTPHEEAVDVLAASVMTSDATYVLDCFEDPVLIFGVGPHPGDPTIGVVWAVGTPGIRKVRKILVRNTKEWLRILGLNYEYLTNFVDARNTTHIRWLQWAGAEFHRKITHPTTNLVFLEFTIHA